MACFADINNVSQGRVATYARCGGSYNIRLSAILPVKIFNWFRLDRIMVMSLWPHFLGPPCRSSSIALKSKSFPDFPAKTALTSASEDYGLSCYLVCYVGLYSNYLYFIATGVLYQKACYCSDVKVIM